jgi:hypothetical protein
MLECDKRSSLFWIDNDVKKFFNFCNSFTVSTFKDFSTLQRNLHLCPEIQLTGEQWLLA